MTAPLNTASLVSELRAKSAAQPAWLLSLLTRATDALESTSRALSEKEGELAEARRSARNNRDGRLAEKDRAETATRQRDEALAALKASEDALKPFARVNIPAYLPDDLWTTCASYEFDAALMPHPLPEGASSPRLTLWLDGISLGAFRRARSALENSPSTLADATNKDPGTEQREAGRNPAYDGPMGIFEGYGEEP